MGSGRSEQDAAGRYPSSVPTAKAFDGMLAAPRWGVYRILVAEDDAEMRRLVVEILRKDGHEVFEAADGRGLLAALTAQVADNLSFPALDLILSDVRMPVHNGLEALEQLARGRLSIIVMTAFADDEIRRRAARLGAVLLDKPITVSALRDAVNDSLRKKRRSPPQASRPSEE